MFFDYAPKDLIEKMYKDLDENNQHERKADMTDDQFYYKTRKRALGKFKNEILALPSEAKTEIAKAWEAQFAQLFDSLSVAGTQSFVNKTITPVKVLPSLDSYIEIVSGDFEEEDTSDLAD
jgi:hypothetical protein